MIRKIGAAALVAVMFMAMASGCTSRSGKSDATGFKLIAAPSDTNAIYNNVPEVDRSETTIKAGYQKFVFGSFGKCCEGTDENVMVSPASILFALEVAGAGAGGNTLNEINNTLVPGLTNEEALGFAVEYYKELDKAGVLNVANGVFVNDDFADSIYEEYYDFIDEKFDAEIDVDKFDEDMVDSINEWCNDETDGMVPSLINSLDPTEKIFIVNTLAFEESWAKPYLEKNVSDDIFTNSNGKEENISMMYSNEKAYLESDKAIGFIKSYSGPYAFVAILPKDETISANEFMKDFTAEDYNEFLRSRHTSAIVHAYLPQFKSDYENSSFVNILKDLGMKDAFDPEKADFSNLSDSDLYISRIIHKTHIEVDVNGTRAAAATGGGAATASGTIIEEEYDVRLDRPFAYAIVDSETGTPIFLGTVNSINS